MNNAYFHIVVKKLINYRGKIIDSDLIKKWLQNMLDSEYNENKLYKTIHKLKNKGEIFTIKKNIFLAKAPIKPMSEEEIIEKYYREILKKHCKDYIDGRWYIGGIKALELNTSNYSIPDDLLIINQSKNANEVIMMDKQIICKTYNSKEKNLFPTFYKYSKKLKIGKYTLPVANLELALLESLYNTPLLIKGYVEELIKTIIRKQHKHIHIDVFATILKNSKHHSSMNRLYQLARFVDEKFAQQLNELIKKYSYLMASDT